MLFSRARAPALALLVVALVPACGDDEVVPDGGPVDADAGGDDRCPGLLTFEAQVADVTSLGSLFEVQVAEVGASNQTTSAPNGRAVLCLPAGADSQVRSTQEGYLARLDTLSEDAVAASLGTDQAYPIDLLRESEADATIGGVRDPAAALLLVSVVSYPEAQPLVGAAVSIDKDHDGAYARDAEGGFAASPDGAIGAGRLVLFANVAASGAGSDGQVAVTVTPPDGYDGSCVGPTSVELEIDGVSGAFFACE